MTGIRRIIFTDKDGASRSPMASSLFSELWPDSGIESLCRGLLVPFPVPLNQKTEAVMISQGIDTSGFLARQLEPDDLTEHTRIFVMEEKQRVHVLEKIPMANEHNTFVLSRYVGDELDIMDPYGGAIQTYGICYEVLRTSIEKLIDKLKSEETNE